MGQRRSGLAVGFAVVVAALCLGGLGVLGCFGVLGGFATTAHAQTQSQTQSQTQVGETIRVIATPLPAPTDLPPAFSWVGGLALSAQNPRLGGVSGLGVGLVPSGVERGVRLLAVTDNGDLLTGDLMLDWTDELRLEGLAGNSLRLYPIRDRQTDLPARQAESLTAWQGQLALGFELRHRVGLMDGEARVTDLPIPIALRDLRRNNAGVEALATLPDGRLFAVAEGVQREGGLRAWVHEAGDEDWPVLVYEWDGEFAPTGADVSPDGRWLVLSERRFISMREPLRNRLVRVPVSAVEPGARLDPEVILDLDPILGAIANVESVSLMATEEPGSVLIFLATDNNFIGLLPTMLAVLLWRPG
ncbi:MAG: esterase-like activity of phytase family protein [Alphaproteobacteria bacterium]